MKAACYLCRPEVVAGTRKSCVLTWHLDVVKASMFIRLGYELFPTYICRGRKVTEDYRLQILVCSISRGTNHRHSVEDSESWIQDPTRESRGSSKENVRLSVPPVLFSAVILLMPTSETLLQIVAYNANRARSTPSSLK